MEKNKDQVVKSELETATVEDTVICETDVNTAYFLLTENYFGITKDVTNIASAIQSLPEEEFFIRKSSAGKLKKEAEALFLCDSIFDNLENGNKIVAQDINYGIFSRPFPRKLISPIYKIK